MRKRKLTMLLLAAAVLTAGCGGDKGKSQETAKNTGEDMAVGESAMEEADAEGQDRALAEEDLFPDTYEKESPSGKVRFHCELVVPEEDGWQTPHKVTVEGLHRCDQEAAWAMFGQGKEISEEYDYPKEEGRIPSKYTVFSDGSGLFLREGLTFSGADSSSYSYVGVFNKEKVPAFESGAVSFKSKEDCVEEVRKAMEELGYDTEQFELWAYPLAYDTMSELEEDEIAIGNLPEDKKKESWGPEDEAYAVYGYQYHQGMPIFHELMGIARVMAEDAPDNGQVMAVYTASGFESLNISDCIYDLKAEEETVELLPFEEIAAVVEEKYEHILDESVYDVTRAKLFMRVYLNEQQGYTAEPVWHFEVTENESSQTVVLVNAQTGKEIYLV